MTAFAAPMPFAPSGEFGECCTSRVTKLVAPFTWRQRDSPKLESLHFPSSGFRKFGQEFHPMGALVNRQVSEDELSQLLGELRTTTCTIAQHNAGQQLWEFIGIRAEDDGNFLYRGMLAEDALNLDRADPHPADFQHVIGTSRVPEIAIGVLIIFVACAQPGAGDGSFGLFVLVPVISTGRVGFYNQVADLTDGHRLIVVVDDLGLEARNYFAAGTGAHCTRGVGN